MFFGTTPAIISQYLEKEFKRINPSKVWVLFSGNFVVEQVAGLTTSAEIESTDVSLYSKAIGHGVTGTTFGLELNEDMKEMFPIIGNVTEPIDLAAQVIFMTEVAQTLKKQHIPYYQALLKTAIENEEDYFKKIKAKLERFAKNTERMRFYGICATKLVDQVQKGDVVFYDPPVILGDYEKMFAPLAKCYKWNDEPYTEITPDVIADHMALFESKGAICYYRTNNPITPHEGYEPVFMYQYKETASYCLYSNRPDKTFVGRFTPLKEEVKKYRTIGEKDVITDKSVVQMIPVKGNIANHYRMMWVKKATMTDGGFAFLVVIDGAVVGVAQVSDGLAFGSDYAVIFSDPACPYSNYKRLSKLIVQVICTKEFLKMFNDMTMWEHTGFTTRVFTNEPVSMKYRGLFELADRIEEKEGNYKYKLVYQNKTNIEKTYQSALQKWLKKDGTVLWKK
jgi:hypothetical protein